MIGKIHIRGFKSLADVEVDLGRVNVFIGANGTGKSAFLEAIGLLGAAASGKVNASSLRERGVRPGLPWLYRSAFAGIDPATNIELSATYGAARLDIAVTNQDKDKVSSTWQFASERLNEANTARVARNGEPTYDPNAGLVALKRVEMAPESDGAKLVDSLSAFRIYTPTTANLRGTVVDPQQQEPLGLSGGRLAEAYGEMLDSTALSDGARRRLGEKPVAGHAAELCAMIGWADDVGTVAHSEAPLSPDVATTRHVLVFRDRFMQQLVSGYDASEGALFVAFAQLLCYGAAPRFAAVENLDHAVNPRLARALMAALCRWVVASDSKAPKPPKPGGKHADVAQFVFAQQQKRNAESRPRQLLLTTHNPLMLDGLPMQDDRFRLFTVDRTNKGRTEIRRVHLDAKLKRMVNEGWTLSRLWVMGHLGGGVPDV